MALCSVLPHRAEPPSPKLGIALPPRHLAFTDGHREHTASADDELSASPVLVQGDVCQRSEGRRDLADGDRSAQLAGGQALGLAASIQWSVRITGSPFAGSPTCRHNRGISLRLRPRGANRRRLGEYSPPRVVPSGSNSNPVAVCVLFPALRVCLRAGP